VLLYRHPEGVGVIKDHMIDMWAEGTAALEADWAANRGPLDSFTFVEETVIRLPGAADISAANMLMEVIDNDRAVPDIAHMHWTHVALRRTKHSLLTSDRPLVMPVGFGHRQCYIALPVGPRDLFVAAHDDRFSRALPTADYNKIVRLMNKDVVAQARQYVWGNDNSQVGFVCKHIATLPDRVILTDAQRASSRRRAWPVMSDNSPKSRENELVEARQRLASDGYSVHSRHTIINGKLTPSQYYGTCR
jgi:hypothetical protein